MLRDAFLSRRAVPEAEHQALELALNDAVAKARAAWPTVSLDADVFAAFLGERGAWPLMPVQVEALWVTCACARGDGAAIAAFERAHFAEVDAAAKQAGAAHLADEVKARVRERLFTGAKAIAEYGGKGALGRWVRTVAAR